MNNDKNSNLREEALAKAREIYGEEAERALRAHLSMVGEELYLWMADLYVPRKCVCNNFDKDGNRVCLLPKDENGNYLCHGGGYYYSNSARDTDGYDIDIESTVQAINFLNTVGMLSGYDNDYQKAFPKQMQLDVCAFAKSLQDPVDGYFYHPRWGKNITLSRQGRDLTWATSILKSFGDTPLYDTKNGVKGSLGSPKTPTDSENSEKNVDTTWTPHLQTLDAFKEYIEALDLKNASYPCANTISAQSGQIIGRDKQGLETGEFTEILHDGYAKGGFVDTLRSLLYSKQNPENGLWEDEVHYNSTNGLMKMMLSYNHFGFKLNYADKAFKSAIQMALLPVGIPDVKGKITSGAVDVYNPWVAMSCILGNVKRFGTEAEHESLMTILKENVVELIKASTEKAKKFKKPDGSFGYTWTKPPSKSQGAPVCPDGFIEGDINGGSIATRGIFSNMVSALGLKIPMFTPEDFEKYIGRIKQNCGYK